MHKAHRIMRRIEMKQNLDKSNRIQLFPITPECQGRLSV